MRRSFGLRLNGFRGSRRAFRLSRLRPPRPTVAPKSSSKLTLRWSKTDSNFRSHRRKITMALGPQATAEPLCRDLLDATYFDDAAAINDGSGAIAGCSQHFRRRVGPDPDAGARANGPNRIARRDRCC